MSIKNEKPPRSRRRLDPNQSRALILDAVERLMRRGGFAAVSARRVAAEAGFKAPLVHYYYPTLDDLLIAFYRRAARQQRERSAEAKASPHPLRAVWALSIDPERAALGAEFLALARHRETIREEIAHEVTAVREIQAELFAPLLADSPLAQALGSAEGAALLLAAGARALVMEEQIGVSKGHADARRFIEACIDRLEAAAETPPDF